MKSARQICENNHYISNKHHLSETVTYTIISTGLVRLNTFSAKLVYLQGYDLDQRAGGQNIGGFKINITKKHGMSF